ncbi:hypothetical protein IE982_06560 [Enterobacter hormaechei]|uniref:Uncharacterized protein n=1 Tax=Enterobacter hormaechei TaxID=158836 RepID=A0A927HM76_9ENTR|nr:hypothetical protein [Enterobacter hormaechei]MBD3706738.1 hypothetical protein [Enterobacter hormaechei]
MALKAPSGNGDKATSPTPKAEQNASANTSDDASASPTLETITASTSWQITDKRGITATTGRLKGDDLEVAKGLGWPNRDFRRELILTSVDRNNVSKPQPLAGAFFMGDSGVMNNLHC